MENVSLNNTKRNSCFLQDSSTVIKQNHEDLWLCLDDLPGGVGLVVGSYGAGLLDGEGVPDKGGVTPPSAL